MSFLCTIILAPLYLSPHFDRSSSNHDRSLLQPSQLFSFMYRAKCTFSDLAYRFLQKSSPSFFPHISSHRPQCTLSSIHSGQSFSNMCGSLYLNRVVQAIEYSGIFSLPSIYQSYNIPEFHYYQMYPITC